MNIATLDYRSSPTASYYEWEMEKERAHWLRRRFLWFCGSLIALSLLMLPLAIYRVFTEEGSMLISARIESMAHVVQLATLGWAWWYARRRERAPQRLFGLAFWLVVGLGVLGMLTARISAEFALADAIRQMNDTRQTRAVLHDRSGTVVIDIGRPRVEAHPEPPIEGELSAARPGEPIQGPVAPPAPNPRVVNAMQQALSLGMLMWSVLLSHFVACLFLPWTVREATRPAIILVGAAAALVLVDVLVGRASAWYVGLAAGLLPAMVLPGIGWCWWRHSRFRRRFRWIFESNQLRQLRQELDGARRIHEASLPPQHPVGPIRLSYTYEPMQQIGGDLIFVHPRPPTQPVSFDNPEQMRAPPKHTMVLLDVTGHGIAAALSVNRLVGELERIFAENPDIGCGELIAALNRYVYLTISTHGIFVTGLALSIDTGEHANCAECFREPHTVCFASAGHPTAFLRRRDGRVDPLKSNAMMLGVLPPEAYEADEHVFTLQPEEAIVAYTDGAAEARNAHDEMIGIDGVGELVARISRETPDPFDWPEQMIRQVAAWRQSPPADDTLIACVYRPAAIPDPHQARAHPDAPAASAPAALDEHEAHAPLPATV